MLPYLSATILTPKTKNIMWHVCILQCNNGSYYTGCTSNLNDRLQRHKMKRVNYTKDKLPIILITYISFSNKYKANDFE